MSRKAPHLGLGVEAVVRVVLWVVLWVCAFVWHMPGVWDYTEPVVG